MQSVLEANPSRQDVPTQQIEGSPRGWEIVKSASLPRSCYRGPRPNHRFNSAIDEGGRVRRST
jgi:hypothetical protein